MSIMLVLILLMLAGFDWLLEDPTDAHWRS
jgi:hypothetical protein